MTSSTEDLTERLRDRKSFRETLEALTALYQSELADQSLDKSARRESLRRQSMQATTQRVTTPRKLSVPPSESTTAVASLLRRLGINPASIADFEDKGGSGGGGGGGGAHKLHEKRANSLENLSNLHAAAESPLATQLIPMDSASQRLSSSLNADSSFAFSLPDADQEKRLGSLEAQLGLVQRGIEGLDLNVLRQRDKAQDRFVERWR